MGDCVAWRALQNSIDAAVTIELQTQAWQTASGIEADGAIEADRELELGADAIAAIGRDLEASDLGNVRHWSDIHRHRYRCGRHRTTIGAVITGDHGEGTDSITVGISGGCPEGLGVVRDGVIGTYRPGRGGLSAAAQVQAAAGHRFHHVGVHLTIDIAGVGNSRQGLETDLSGGVFLGAHHSGAQDREGGCIVHRRDGERARCHGARRLAAVADLPFDGAGGAGGGGVVAAADVGERPQCPEQMDQGWLRRVLIGARGERKGEGIGIPAGLHTGIATGLSAQRQHIARRETSANAHRGRAEIGAIGISEGQLRVEE